MKQKELWDEDPKVKAGRTLVKQRGIRYMRQIASRGGQAVVEKYGSDYMRALGRRGAEALEARRYQPQTRRRWDGAIVRTVGWKREGSRRKRPELIEFVLDERHVGLQREGYEYGTTYADGDGDDVCSD